MKHDWKKSEKQYYLPGPKPELITIPPFGFFSVPGTGDPNDKAFAEVIGVLYSLAYSVKMSSKNNFAPKDYFDYTVYPLEGIWDLSEKAKRSNSPLLDKSQLVYNLMIRQPAFVTPDFAREAVERTKKKKYHPLLEKAVFEIIGEGPCIQMMHTGSYDNEAASFRLMEDHCVQQGLRRISKQHREIYLSDFRKVSKEKLKTILRFRVEAF